MSQQNMMLVRQAIEEIWNRGNYALMDEFVARDLVIHAPTPGHEIHGAVNARRRRPADRLP